MTDVSERVSGMVDEPLFVHRLDIRAGLIRDIIQKYQEIAREQAQFGSLPDGTTGREAIEKVCYLAVYTFPDCKDADDQDARRAVFARAGFLAYMLLRNRIFETKAIETALEAGWLLVQAEGGVPLATRACATAELLEELSEYQDMSGPGALPTGARERLEAYYAQVGICQAGNVVGHRPKDCHDGVPVEGCEVAASRAEP